MKNNKFISLLKLILFGYYLPAVAIIFIPALFSLSFYALFLSFVIPFWVIAMGIPLTAWFPFDQVWGIYVFFAVSGLVFLAGLYFHDKTWGKVLVLAGLWGWTFISALAVGMHY